MLHVDRLADGVRLAQGLLAVVQSNLIKEGLQLDRGRVPLQVLSWIRRTVDSWVFTRPTLFESFDLGLVP